MTHIVGVHGGEVAVARAMHTDIPAILAIEDVVRILSKFIIVEIEDLFNLGHQPDAH